MAMNNTLPQFPPELLDPEYLAEDHSSRVVATAITFIVLEISIVICRFFSRRLIKAKLDLDDYLIFPSLLFCLSLCVLGIVEAYMAGIGRHLVYLLLFDPEAIFVWAKGGTALEQLYCVAVVLPKLSILASYLRILTVKKYRITAYVLAAIIISNGIAGVVTSFAACKPFGARYESLTSVEEHCIDLIAYWRWISLPNIITDLVMLGLPIPVLWNLHMPKRDRIAVLLIFITGSIGIITAVIRFSTFFNARALTTDGTFISADLAIWSIVEPGVYMMAACLPTLRPLVLKLTGRLGAPRTRTIGTSAQNSIPMKWQGQHHTLSSKSDEEGILMMK